MKSQHFTNTLPPVSDRVFLTALQAVIEYLFDDEYRDFTANPKADHIAVDLMILLVWVGDLPDRVSTLR